MQSQWIFITRVRTKIYARKQEHVKPPILTYNLANKTVRYRTYQVPTCYILISSRWVAKIAHVDDLHLEYRKWRRPWQEFAKEALLPKLLHYIVHAIPDLHQPNKDYITHQSKHHACCDTHCHEVPNASKYSLCNSRCG